MLDDLHEEGRKVGEIIAEDKKTATAPFEPVKEESQDEKPVHDNIADV